MVLWDTERHPDYQMFLEVAVKSETRLIIFASREFVAADTEDLSQLDDPRPHPRGEARIRQAPARPAHHEGVTCSLELAFDYHSRLYVYEMQPDWYDEFLSVEDEIMSLLAEPEDMDDDDREPLGGYFSKN